MGPIDSQVCQELVKLSNKCILESNRLYTKKRGSRDQNVVASEAYMHMSSGIQQALYILQGYLKDFTLKPK